MRRKVFHLMLAAAVSVACGVSQETTDDPYSDPIPATADVIGVSYVEFASLPDVDGGAARTMQMVDESGTGRLFVNDMVGPMYTVSYDGKTVTPYLDVNGPQWKVGVQSGGNERGVQNFEFHPQFAEKGTAGYGKFYTWTDVDNEVNKARPADFLPGEGEGTHDTVLLEWTAKNPAASHYDGVPPRELFRVHQPFRNHNGGDLRFNPLAGPGDSDFGMLYIGVADGGSGGDPMNLAQNLMSAFGKIFRIAPLGSNSENGRYGIPADNPFVGRDDALGEIFALGVRNPQRFGWDSKTGQMYVADIGQNIVEEVSPVSSGANLGWKVYEGSFPFVSRTAVRLDNHRGDPSMTYPIAEWGQPDPLFQPQSAATGVHVYREGSISQLMDLILFGDIPSGEIFYVQADNPPNGDQAAIRRVLLKDGGELKTLLQLIQAKNLEQGREPATRADFRLGSGPNGQVFLLNKRDGVIRLLVADSE